MAIKIALIGKPNSGKTTLFNALTGANQHVGNWPGVTVEKKEGKLKKHKDVIVTDLPGIYSLSPYSLEEVVSRNYILNEKPDVVINLVDASNIERNLYLTTQVLELGVPVVMALNMIDVADARGDKIDDKKLADDLGCEIVRTSALKGKGVDELVKKALEVAKLPQKTQSSQKFSDKVESAILEIEKSVEGAVPAEQARWYAVKLFENDRETIARAKFTPEVYSRADELRKSIEAERDDDAESIITDERYNNITAIVGNSVQKKAIKESTSDKIDRIITNRLLALPIFAAIMFLVYWLSISTIGTIGTDWVNDVLFGDGGIPALAERGLSAIGASDLIMSLVIDGIIAGVGAVLGFVPQIVVLYLCLSILEDVGYMARIAFIMDRIFRKFGLSGKSFIPILIGTGCSVPGIMGTRTIENEKDRRMTIIVSTFMPCGAKLPIIALVVNGIFAGAWYMAPITYFVAIFGIVVSGIILKKTQMFLGDPAPFIMELPAYHAPKAKGVLIHTWERAKAFMIKAGTVILLATIVLWLLMRFTPSFKLIDFEEAGEQSILAVIGSAIAPIFKPLGFGTWEATIATFTGLIAKEQLISTFGIMTNLGNVDPELANEMGTPLHAMVQSMFTAAGAYSFLIFNLFCTPCVAAIGAIRREMNSRKWTWIAIVYQLAFAYCVSLIIYQIGSVLIDGASFGVGTAVAIIVLILGIYLLVRRPRKSAKSEVLSSGAVSGSVK